jgi:FtsH-binding integral membrane protein
MLGYLATGVNNDVFLLLFSALVFDRLSRGLTSLFTWRDIVWLGVWTGLAAMTKQQGWVLVVATTLGLFFQRRQLGWRRASKMLGTFFVLALIIGASWGARGLIVDQNNFIECD